MNPDASSPNFELPTPQSNVENAGEQQQAENAVVPVEKAPMPSAPPVQTSLPPPPHPVFTQSSNMNNDQKQPGQASAQLTADDNDLIEKEWVQKAKQILSSTKDDPYAQTKEIGKIKADYLKKRYNKDIRLEES